MRDLGKFTFQLALCGVLSASILPAPAACSGAESADLPRQELLGPGDLLLAYDLELASPRLVALTADEHREIDLTAPADLSQRIELFRGLLSSPPDPGGAGRLSLRHDALERAARSLADLLLGSVEDLLADRDRILIQANGSLDGLPFRLLGDARWGRNASAPSFLRYWTLAAPQHESASSDEGPKAAPLGLAVGEADAALPGLRRESTRLLSRYRGVRRQSGSLMAMPLGERARFDFIHIAHPFRLEAPPAGGANLIWGRGAETRSLPFAEIAAQSLNARLLTLSSQAAGSMAPPEAAVAGELARAWHRAGVSTVLLALWPGDDAATAELMGHFYASLAGGESAAGALRFAQDQLRLGGRWQDPFFWSGFALSGDGGLQLPLERRQNPVLLSLLFGFSLVCVFLWFLSGLFRRRRGAR